MFNANLIVFDDSDVDGNREFYNDTLLPLIDQYINEYKVCINVIELPERQLTKLIISRFFPIKK